MLTHSQTYERRDGALVFERSYYLDGDPPDYLQWETEMWVTDHGLPVVGQEYQVAVRQYVGPDCGRARDGDRARILWQADCGGWAGNSNPDICRYTGWRGTTDDWALYGEGVRKCKEARIARRVRMSKIRIVFGPAKKGDD